MHKQHHHYFWYCYSSVSLQFIGLYLIHRKNYRNDHNWNYFLISYDQSWVRWFCCPFCQLPLTRRHILAIQYFFDSPLYHNLSLLFFSSLFLACNNSHWIPHINFTLLLWQVRLPLFHLSYLWVSWLNPDFNMPWQLTGCCRKYSLMLTRKEILSRALLLVGLSVFW